MTYFNKETCTLPEFLDIFRTIMVRNHGWGVSGASTYDNPQIEISYNEGSNIEETYWKIFGKGGVDEKLTINDDTTNKHEPIYLGKIHGDILKDIDALVAKAKLHNIELSVRVISMIS